MHYETTNISASRLRDESRRAPKCETEDCDTIRSTQIELQPKVAQENKKLPYTIKTLRSEFQGKLFSIVCLQDPSYLRDTMQMVLEDISVLLFPFSLSQVVTKWYWRVIIVL